MALVALLLGSVLGLAAPRMTAAHERSEAAATYLVREGESLWTLAERFAPDRDPRWFVFESTRLNGLESSYIFPGQRLFLPAS